MSVIRLPWTAPAPAHLRGGCVSFGNFDGAHRGHAELARAARRLSGGMPAVLVTFDPPPVTLLRPELPPRLPLTTLEARARLLGAAGATAAVVLGADAELLSLNPAGFIDRIVLGVFGASSVVEGYDFRFGQARAGDTSTLRELCDARGIGVEIVPPLLDEDEPVSSSRVRRALTAGDVATAARLLGRPYSVSGMVGRGAARGRTIGFPTANLDGVATLLPADGVYAGRATLPTGQVHAAAVNLGPNPTFGEGARKLEIHLLDFAGDLYDSPLALEFRQFLRGTRPFAGRDELVEQLRRDVAEVRELALEWGTP